MMLMQGTHEPVKTNAAKGLPLKKVITAPGFTGKALCGILKNGCE